MEMKETLESKGEVEFKVCTLGENVTITNKMVTIKKEKIKEHQRVFTPSVIEPSFGIVRIIYCLCEHCFYARANKGALCFPWFKISSMRKSRSRSLGYWMELVYCTKLTLQVRCVYLLLFS